MIREAVLLIVFLGGLALVGGEDRRSAEVTAQIVDTGPRPITHFAITHYTIKQDSPGYEPRPFPLTHPMSGK